MTFSTSLHWDSNDVQLNRYFGQTTFEDIFWGRESVWQNRPNINMYLSLYRSIDPVKYNKLGITPYNHDERRLSGDWCGNESESNILFYSVVRFGQRRITLTARGETSYAEYKYNI